MWTDWKIDMDMVDSMGDPLHDVIHSMGTDSVMGWNTVCYTRSRLVVRAVGLFWIVVQPSVQWPQDLLRLIFGYWSLEWPGWWSLGINGFRGVFFWPLGYIIRRVQVEGVWGYDKDQVALVVPNSTVFDSWVPVTLCTPIINQIINIIKETKLMGCWLPWMDWGWHSCWCASEQNFWLREKLPYTKQWIWLT